MPSLVGRLTSTSTRPWDNRGTSNVSAHDITPPGLIVNSHVQSGMIYKMSC